MAQFLHLPKREVSINGVRRRAYGVDVQLGTTSPVAQVNFTCRKTDGEIAGGDIVTVRMGYAFPLPVVFEGEVNTDTITYWPNMISTTARGFLSRAEPKFGSDGEEDLTDIETGEPVPVMQWSGVTGAQIIAEILDKAQVPYGELYDDGIELGNIEPVTLMPDESPLAKIQQIDEDFGCITIDFPDGVVRRIPFSDVPAWNPALVIEQGKGIRAEASRERGMSEVRNRAMVSGVPNDAFTPSVKIDATTLATSPTTGRPYIPSGVFRAYIHQSSLLETEALCEAHAMRKLGELNRLRWTTSIPLTKGWPNLRAGQSCFVKSDALDFDTGQIFFIETVDHRSDQSGIFTSVVLRGAFAAEGVNTNLAPLPSFTMTIIREFRPGDGDIYIIICDATGSTDPDGAYEIPPSTNELGQEIEGYSSNGIAAYEWDSTLGVEPSLSEEGARATFVVVGNPNGETITLTVYDLQGRDGVAERTIVINNDRPALVRDLWAAMGSVLLFTNDGERTWQRIDIPAVFVCEIAAYDYTIALDASGTVYRVVTTLAYTTPLSAPTNASCASVRWEYPDTRVSGERAWIGTANGEIWRSTDRSLTWDLVATLDGGPRIVSISESPFAENDIWVTAANKIYHSYDGATFEMVYQHTNTALIATNHASGFESGYVAFHGDPPAESPGSEASRVRERFNQIAGDWDREGLAASLPPGDYEVAYSIQGAGGETGLSPSTTVTIASDKALSVGPITPLPQGAYAVYIYISDGPDSPTLLRWGSLTGWTAHTISTLPVGPAHPGVNQTLIPIANPTTAPTASAIDAIDGQIDFPAQPNWLTMGIDRPLLIAAGSSPAATLGMMWVAEADAPFTFRRGFWPLIFGIPRHVVRDNNAPGIAYAAAPAAIVKSTSYYQSDAFAIYDAVGDEEGWFVGQGDLHPVIVRGNIIWVATTFYASGDLPATVVVNGLSADGFVRLSDHPCAGQTMQAAPLLSAGDGVLLTYGRQGAGTGVSGKFEPSADNNSFRSTDGGVTWDPTGLTAVAYMATDGAGIVYAICWGSAASQTGTTLQRSDDGGATWSSVYSSFPLETAHSGIAPSHLIIDPTNPDTIIVRQNSIYISHNGGASFTSILSINDHSNFGTRSDTAYVPNGTHFLYSGDQTVGEWRLYNEAGSGGTAVLSAAQAGLSIFSVQSGGYVYLYGGIHPVWRSPDGVTWEEALDEAHLADALPPGFATHIEAAAFVPGDAGNGWYWFSSFRTADVPMALGAQGVDPPDTYVSLKAQLDAAYPDGAYWCSNEGAARLAAD